MKTNQTKSKHEFDAFGRRPNRNGFAKLPENLTKK